MEHETCTFQPLPYSLNQICVSVHIVTEFIGAMVAVETLGIILPLS